MWPGPLASAFVGIRAAGERAFEDDRRAPAALAFVGGALSLGGFVITRR